MSRSSSLVSAMQCCQQVADEMRWGLTCWSEGSGEQYPVQSSSGDFLCQHQLDCFKSSAFLWCFITEMCVTGDWLSEPLLDHLVTIYLHQGGGWNLFFSCCNMVQLVLKAEALEIERKKPLYFSLYFSVAKNSANQFGISSIVSLS